MEKVRYLGDGLCTSYDGFQIALMANDKDNPTDTVYLDYEVLEAFEAYVKDLREEKNNVI